jgi:Family of unknown function (DUF6580)
MHKPTTRADLLMDLAMVAFLVAFDVTARLLPHAPGFLPVAASGLFAARMLRIPALAVIVPLAAMAVSGFGLASDDWRVTLVVYGAIAVPALAGMFSRRWRGALAVVATMVSCSLFFFLSTNFAVWAFSGIYAHSVQGLTECYVLALPFLQKTVLGDLMWTAVLFGGAWLVQRGPALAKRPLI